MDDGSRAFLLALAAVPACGPAVNADATGDESDMPGADADASEDDAGNPGADEVLDTCEAHATKVVECDLETYGRTYGPYDPAAYCELVIAYAGRHGEHCVAAQDEMFVCTLRLDCAPFQDFIPVECRDVYVSGHERCPQVLGFCVDGWSVGAETSCEAGATACIDGRAYTVRCESTRSDPGVPARSQCECEVDGTVSGAFLSELDCIEDGFRQAAETACGWPQGTLS